MVVVAPDGPVDAAIRVVYDALDISIDARVTGALRDAIPDIEAGAVQDLLASDLSTVW
jgi:hypothetical protein